MLHCPGRACHQSRLRRLPAAVRPERSDAGAIRALATQVVQGNFGNSLRNQRPVTDIVLERLPMTMEITIGAMLFSTFFGIIFGIISAIRQNSSVDVLTMLGANIGVSMPVFWLGLMLEYVFALTLEGHAVLDPAVGPADLGPDILPRHYAEAFHLPPLGGPWMRWLPWPPTR